MANSKVLWCTLVEGNVILVSLSTIVILKGGEKLASQRNAVAIMSVFSMAMGIGTITPAIQDIAEAFPHLGFSTICLPLRCPLYL